jgi:hypothetical protein
MRALTVAGVACAVAFAPGALVAQSAGDGAARQAEQMRRMQQAQSRLQQDLSRATAQNTELTARVATLEAELKQQKAAANLITNAWRMARERLKNKSKAVTEARRDERAKGAAKAKEVQAEEAAERKLRGAAATEAEEAERKLQSKGIKIQAKGALKVLGGGSPGTAKTTLGGR